MLLCFEVIPTVEYVCVVVPIATWTGYTIPWRIEDFEELVLEVVVELVSTTTAFFSAA
jgi:hypothetical protein